MRRSVLALAVLVPLVGVSGSAVRAQVQHPPPHTDVFFAPGHEGDALFVHTWVLRLSELAGSATTAPRYEVVHTSEGPFEAMPARDRQREIATKGLEIGSHYYPLHRVQLVELRRN